MNLFVPSSPTCSIGALQLADPKLPFSSKTNPAEGNGHDTLTVLLLASEMVSKGPFVL